MKLQLLFACSLTFLSFHSAQSQTTLYDFETTGDWAYFANGSVTTFQAIANPVSGGINTSATVGEYIDSQDGNYE